MEKMIKDYNLSPEAMIMVSGSSIGTQKKYYAKGYWYKQNRIGYEGIAGEVLGAVEAHVLKEMCEAALIVALYHRANVACKKEIGAACRDIVLADVVGESVGKGTGADCGISYRSICRGRKRYGDGSCG